MTIESQTVEYSYVGDGATLSFPFPSRFLAGDDIIVGLDSVLQTGGYAATGAGDDNGGSIVFTVAPAVGVVVLLVRAPPLSQLTNYLNGQTVLESTLEVGLDKLTMITQWLARRVSRSVRSGDLSPESYANGLVLPDPSARAGFYFGFDSNGNIAMFSNPVVAPVGTTPLTTTVGFPAAAIPLTTTRVKTTGYVAANDGGDADFADTGLGSIPVGGKGYVISGARVFGIYDQVLMPQQFGGQGIGGDDTAAFNDMFKAAFDRRRPVYIPNPPVAWRVAPITLPATEGQTVRGQNMRATVIQPVSNAQAHILALPYALSNLDMSDLYFDQFALSAANKATWAIISDAGQNLRMNRVRLESPKGGVWWRKGGYHDVKNITVSRHTADAHRFGGEYTGSGGTLQMAQSRFENFLVEAIPAAVGAGVGVAFSFQSGAAFLNCVDFTCAGQATGVQLVDNTGGGVGTRPDGITLQNANFDYVDGRCIDILSAGLVRIYSGSFRSLTNYAIVAQDTNDLRLDGTATYASALGGLAINGGVSALKAVNFRAVANGYPSNTGAVGVYIVGANGVLRFDGGSEVGNGTASPLYAPQGAANLQDYGFVLDAGFTGSLELDGVRVRDNRLAPHLGLTDVNGDLRAGVRVLNTLDDGFRTDNTKRETVTADGSGNVLIPHKLLGRPTLVNVERFGAAEYPKPRIANFDATNIQITFVNAAGAAVGGAVADIMWEAKMRSI